MATTSRTRAISELSVQGARFYPVEEPRGLNWLPSTTTALDVWPKPALVTWSASSEKAGILGELESWLHADESASRGAMLDRLLALREAPLRYREVSRKAKDIGSSAHAWLEWHVRVILGITIGPEPVLLPGAEKAVMAALEWMKQVSLKPIDVERRVFDAKIGYAGRYDLKAEVDWDENGKTERRRVIVDWKSSKGIYPDMIIQNIAYRQADAITANGSRSNGGIIVRLAKEENDPVPCEPVQVPFTPQAFECFKAALAFWRLWRAHEGKWAGGYATEAEVAALSKKKSWGY